MAGCKVIGLYGGAGSGKSEAARILKEKYNAYIIKADDLGHRLYKKNSPGYKAVIRICGKDVLKTDGEIDYGILASMLFHNEVLRKKVNAAIHPMVYAKAQCMINDYKRLHCHGLVFFEAALLPERPLEFIDENWYIHSDTDVRSTRMKDTRNYSDEKIVSVIEAQPDPESYKAYCDVTIENNKTLKELEENIDEALKHSKRKQW